MKNDMMTFSDNDIKIRQIDDAIKMLMDMTNITRYTSFNKRASYAETFFKDVKNIISGTH